MEAAKASKATGQTLTSFYKYLSLHGQHNGAVRGRGQGNIGKLATEAEQKMSYKAIFFSALRAEISYISKL